MLPTDACAAFGIRRKLQQSASAREQIRIANLRWNALQRTTLFAVMRFFAQLSPFCGFPGGLMLIPNIPLTSASGVPNDFVISE